MHAYIIDQERLSKLRNAGANESFLDRIEKNLIGRYITLKELKQAQEAEFGPDYLEIVQKELSSTGYRINSREFGKLKYYYASGYLGQYLVIYPNEKIVGVRMYEQISDGNAPYENFNDFPEMLGKL